MKKPRPFSRLQQSRPKKVYAVRQDMHRGNRKNALQTEMYRDTVLWGGASFYHLPNYCCYKKGHKKQRNELFCSVANFYQLSCNFKHSGGSVAPPPRPHKYLADYKRYQTNTLRSMSVCCAPQMMEDLRKLGSLPGVRQFLCNAIELLDSFVLQPIIEERKDLLCCLAMRFGGYKSDETRKTTLQADTSGSNDSSMKCFEHFN